ncbi:uncharacterized protein EV422DRAFT_505971 [Fimicolochytrium jonesii]|uniref:uncharacterized protein n=1 Tax=Fimicolochytrium jonesii TaxID=1396493 RepID=UPI0022FE57D1|nr:uncharacterized protein EV422DRAFT_505971 [Fimicolochytrium jonesii]KAI8821254.1 hypothetical protein EV422DRAFT_505971 [Fimicolochytrium jonesii]
MSAAPLSPAVTHSPHLTRMAAPAPAPPQYVVRESLKGALRGPHYQVLLAQHYMLARLEQLMTPRFGVRLEVNLAGAWDDVVFDFIDAAGAITERHFIQQKHHNVTGSMDWAFVKNKTGMELYKYFDDWFLLLSPYSPATVKKAALPSVQPGGRSLCVFCTNDVAGADLQAVFEPVSTAHSFEPIPLLNGETLSPVYHRLNLEFRFPGRTRLSPLEVLRTNIKKHSLLMDRNSAINAGAQARQNPTVQAAYEYFNGGGIALTDVQMNGYIEEFLRDHLLVATNQPHVDTFDALQNANVWTEVILRQYVSSIAQQITTMPQEIGVTRARLNQVMTEMEAHVRIDRPGILQSLRQHHTQAAPGLKSNWYGASGVGKSSLAAVLLSELVTAGKSLFFDTPQTFCAATGVFGSTTLICVDQVDTATQADVTRHWTNNAVGAHLLCISVEELWPAEPKLLIPPLTTAEVDQYLQSRRLSDHMLILSKISFMLLQSGLPPPPGTPDASITGLQQLMRLPRTLLKVCAHAVPFAPQPAVTAAGAYAAAKSASRVRIIPLRVKRQVPTYSFESLSTHSRFIGAKIISTTQIDAALLHAQLHARSQYERQISSRKQRGDESSPLGHLTFDVEQLGLDVPIDTAVDLRTLLQQKLSEADYERLMGKSLWIILLDRNGIAAHWSAARMLQFSQFNMLTLITTAETTSPVDGCCHFRASNGVSAPGDRVLFYLVSSMDRFERLPLGDSYCVPKADQVWIDVALPVLATAGVTLLTAEAGSGKSVSMKMIHWEFHQNIAQQTAYTICILVSFRELAAIISRSATGCSSLEQLAFLLLQLPPELKCMVKEDLAKGRVLFLLDAWDEVQSSSERQALQEVMRLLRAYAHVMYSSRPMATQPMQPSVTFELQRFSDPDTEEFIKSYFRSVEDVSDWSEGCIGALRAHRSSLHEIGLPLQCFLVCEAWQPAFEDWCQDRTCTKPWDGGVNLDRLYLFRMFITARIQATALTDESVAIYSRPFLERLQEVAAGVLLKSHLAAIDHSSIIGSSIARLNVLQDSGEFMHQTYAEYLTAQFLVRTLLIRPSDGSRLVKKHRFHSSLALVFEFLAAMLSTQEGDLFVPASADARISAMRSFWEALLSEPQNSAGSAREVMLRRCLLRTHLNDASAIFDDSAVAVMRSLHDSVAPVSSHVSNEESKDEDEMVDVAAAAVPAGAAAQVDFQAPKLPHPYAVIWRCNIIDSVDLRVLSAAGKVKAMAWLVNLFEHHCGSYRVAEAVADKLGNLGMASPAVLKPLVSAMVREGYGHKESFSALVGMGVSLEKIQQLAEAHNFPWKKPPVETVLAQISRAKWPISMVKWFARQSDSVRQPDALLGALFRGAEFPVQPDVVLCAMQLHSPDDSFDRKLLDCASDGTTPVSSRLLIWLHLPQHGRQSDVRLTASTNASGIITSDSQTVLSELLSRCCNAEEAGRACCAQIESFLSMVENDGARTAWLPTLLHMIEVAIKERSCKALIPVLVEHAVHLHPPFSDTRSLWMTVFSHETNSRGSFWDCKAVVPSFGFSFPYWSEVSAVFMVYKLTGTFCDDLSLGSSFEAFATAAESFSEDQQRWAIWACAHVIEHRIKNGDDEHRVLPAFRQFGFSPFSPAVVCEQLLSDNLPRFIFPPDGALDTSKLDTWAEFASHPVASPETRARVLQMYLEQSSRVLSFPPDEEGTLIVHLDTRDMPLQTTPDMRTIVRAATSGPAPLTQLQFRNSSAVGSSRPPAISVADVYTPALDLLASKSETQAWLAT